ncbi:MAG: AsmA family protein, partial [Gammaproteobacteria bacterium]
MKRLFKFLFTLLGLLVLLIVIAAIVIPLVVDPNDYKDQITALVEKRTGRTFSIPGKIELSVFPWLGIETGEVALGNAPGFGEQPFVKANKVEVRVQLLPLLEKHVEMDTIVIEGMTLNLARDKNGKTNWQDLLIVAEEP